jgi:hypothetical protein
VPVEAAGECAPLQRRFMDQSPWRYGLIRPLVLFAEPPASPAAIRQRAQDTGTHPETVRTCTRRFAHQGMLGLVPQAVAVVPTAQAPSVPEAVVEALARRKTLSPGFQ